MCVLEVLF